MVVVDEGTGISRPRAARSPRFLLLRVPRFPCRCGDGGSQGFRRTNAASWGAIRCACNGTVVHRLSRSVLPGIRCLDHATLARISETHSAWPSSLSDSASQASSRASSKRTSKTDFT